MVDTTDGTRARRIVLRSFDLPGAGWAAVPTPDPAAATGPDDDLLDACLAGFPDPDVTASAESDRFTRAHALAYSVAWILSSEAAAEIAFATLAHERFASAFVAAMAAEVDPGAGSATLLGHVAEQVEGFGAKGPKGDHLGHRGDGPPGQRLWKRPDCFLPAPKGHSAAHQARLTAADVDGVLPIHLELLALHEERAVALVILADSPDPMAAADVTAVAERVAIRMPG
ncbi:MAG: hypothetical protein ACR2K0_09405 [Acidimicrobiales bacterium]